MTKTVVFLEPRGTVLEVIRAAKERGFRIAALVSDVKLLQSAPAPYDSAVPMIDDLIEVEGWADPEPIFEYVAKLHAKNPVAGIYAGVDPCAVVLASLRNQYGLPAPSPKAMVDIIDKFRLRDSLRSHGLSRLTHSRSETTLHWKKWPFQGAAYFKPVHGCRSAYVTRCESLDDLRRAVAQWNQGSPPEEPTYIRQFVRTQADYHVEESFEGELLSVEAFISNGQFRPLGLLSRILYSKDPVVEMGSCFPYLHPLSEKIIRLVEDAHRVLGFTEGVSHTEVIVSTSGEIEIIDLNPRFVGADVMQSINFAFDVKIQNALLDFALGAPITLPSTIRQYSCLQYFLPPTIPLFEKVDFPKASEVPFHSIFRKPGSPIFNQARQYDHLGTYLTVMPTFDQALTRSKELRSQVLINGDWPGVY